MSHMVTSHDRRRMTGNQYKPHISMFIRDTFSIKDKTIHEGDHYETEHRFMWETHTPSTGAAGLLLYIYEKFTTLTLKLSLIKKVSFKLWSRSSSVSGNC